jgi:hypothetical protein
MKWQKGDEEGTEAIQRWPNLSNIVLSLFDDGDKNISDIRNFIMETVNGNRMTDYMVTK